MVSLQDEPMVLASGGKARSGFFGWFEPDQPAATAASDAGKIDAVLALPEAAPPPWPDAAPDNPPAPALFSSAPLLASLALDQPAIVRFFGEAPRHPESGAGQLLSFFTGDHSHNLPSQRWMQSMIPNATLYNYSKEDQGDHSSPHPTTPQKWMPISPISISRRKAE
jgi:hypothetical protein